MAKVSLNSVELPYPLPASEIYYEPLVNLDECKNDCIIISYTFPGFDLTEIKRYPINGKELSFRQLNIPKTGFRAEAGKCLLPSFGRFVQIPFNTDFDSKHDLQVLKCETFEYKEIDIFPAQDFFDQAESFKLTYDEDFYDSDTYYPDSVVASEGPFEIDGYNALLLHVTPFQYNPKKRRLIGYGRITVSLTIKPKKDGHYFLSDTIFSREAFGNLFLNPVRGIELRLGSRLSIQPKTVGAQIDLLIIYYPKFEKAAIRLAIWKRKRGLRVEIVSTGTIGKTVDEIKKYIREKREGLSARLRYVLLFGDSEFENGTPLIETEMVEGKIDGKIKKWRTDYYYTTAHNPTTVDEIVLPQIAIGRIPVQTCDNAEKIVTLICNYEEKGPTSKNGYYRRIMLAAHFQDELRDGTEDRAYVRTMERIYQRLEMLDFTVERVYTSDIVPASNSSGAKKLLYIDEISVSEIVANKLLPIRNQAGEEVEAQWKKATDEIKNLLKKGCMIIAHRGHGSEFGWDQPRFITDTVQDLNNLSPFMIFSVNCNTGNFGFILDTLADKLLNRGLTPSVIAATGETNTWLNDYILRALFDALWAGVIPTISGGTASYPMKYSRIGDILEYAKLYLLVKYLGRKESIKQQFEMYHVLGDPTLEIWTTKPRVMKLRIKQDEAQLSISLLSAQCPRGSVVTIWRKDNDVPYKRIEPYTTYFTVSIKDIVLWSSPTRLIVCFWAPGYRFRQVSVKINPI